MKNLCPFYRVPVNIDQNLAVIENNEVKLVPNSGYSLELPNDKAIYRGIYYDELLDIVKTGKINSQGNLVSSQTFFADGTQNVQQAAEYALGYASNGQWSRIPSFEKPNFLLVVKKPDKNPDLVRGSIEIAYAGPIDAKDIIAIYEVRPYLIKEGYYPLETGTDWIRPTTDFVLFSKNQPEISTVYKRLTFEEAVSKFSPPQTTTFQSATNNTTPTLSGPDQTSEIPQIISDVHTQVQSELAQLKTKQEIVDYITHDLESMGVEIRNGTPRFATKGYDVMKDVSSMSENYFQINDRNRPMLMAHEWEHAKQVKALLDAGIPTGLVENKLYQNQVEAAAYATGTKLSYSAKAFDVVGAITQPIAFAVAKVGLIGPLNAFSRIVTRPINALWANLTKQ